MMIYVLYHTHFVTDAPPTFVPAGIVDGPPNISIQSLEREWIRQRFHLPEDTEDTVLAYRVGRDRHCTLDAFIKHLEKVGFKKISYAAVRAVPTLLD